MKKFILLILLLILLIVGYKIIHNYKNNDYYNKDKYTHYQNQRKDYSNKNDYSNYNEVDGEPFNKGYNGDYNKVAVEKANKKYSTVTLNKKFTVEGLSHIDGVNATVVKFIDGDTIVVNIDGKKTTIRFASMDTAEDVNPKINVIEPYSIQGADYVKSKIKIGEAIKIVTNGETGKYGRTVGYIYYNNNGKWYNLNEELVSNGLARIAYVSSKEKHSKLIDEFYKAEDSARSQKLNIWSIQGYATSLGYNLAIFK